MPGLFGGVIPLVHRRPHLVELGQAVAPLDDTSASVLENVGHCHQLGPWGSEGQSLGMDLCFFVRGIGITSRQGCSAEDKSQGYSSCSCLHDVCHPGICYVFVGGVFLRTLFFDPLGQTLRETKSPIEPSRLISNQKKSYMILYSPFRPHDRKYSWGDRHKTPPAFHWKLAACG